MKIFRRKNKKKEADVQEIVNKLAEKMKYVSNENRSNWR